MSLPERQCKCGNKRFTASQRCYHDVIVNESGIFEENISIFESERPYGPFRCTKCGAVYEYLDQLEKC